MELKKLLGRNIKKYRKLNGLTQEQLAESIGVEVISISSIETGRYFPAPENLVKIAETLNIPIKYLFDFKSEQNCDEIWSEISSNLKFLKNNQVKLTAVNEFVKSLM